MSTVSMTGNDTIIINNRVLNDLADGDVASLTFPNDMAVVKTGKNGNSLYAVNQTGKIANFSVRILRGSADDKFLNGLLAQQKLNFANFVLMTGELIKQVGDGLGNVTQDTYVISGGVFQKEVEATSNVEGNTDQSIAIYSIVFSNAPRVIT